MLSVQCVGDELLSSYIKGFGFVLHIQSGIMVDKPRFNKETQQQMQEKVHPQPSKSYRKYQCEPNSRSVPIIATNLRRKRAISTPSSSFAFFVLLLIYLFSHVADGATLLDDLSTSNERSSGDPVRKLKNDNETSSLVSADKSSITTTTTTTVATRSTTSSSTATVTSTIPSYEKSDSNANDGKIGSSRSSTKAGGEKSELTHSTRGDKDAAHVKLITIPIDAPLSDKAPIIVKHGNVIYEVINNGTVSTNEGSQIVPVVKKKSSQSNANIFSHVTAKIIGLRIEDSNKPVTYEKGASKILADHKTTIRFFGSGFTNNTIIRFVGEEGRRETDCDDVTSTKYFYFQEVFPTSAIAIVQIPPLNQGDHKYYLCVKEHDNEEMPWIHQGSEESLTIITYQKWLPLWAHIALLVLLLTLSGLFSGLNLGLMAIDRTELKIIMNAGSDKEKRHAQKIRPLRENGNYLLCSLLLGNVLVNATLTILLDDLTTGLVAVVGSTLGIVIFGEIVPQAVCSRHGLAVGAKTVWITKIFMLLTFPMSYPISIILDKILGEEIGNVYNRARLKELIRLTQSETNLEKDEVNIISGALDLNQKTVADVMTKLEDIFMLPIDSVLDFETVSDIMNNGYSRIPVYEHHRGNVISLLYTKDLAFVDPDDKMPLRTICEFYSNPCHFVFENVTLNVIFNVFKQGNKGHMAFVQRIKSGEKSDPTYEVIGLVTMEDVIEELIQEEINDETDVWGDSETRRHSRENVSPITDMAISNLKTEGTTVSPHLTLAAFQYLSTAVEEFNVQRISKTVLEKLLKQNIYFHIKIKNKDTSKTDPSTILYERGKPADYFIMILEGRVIAEVGKENLIFESGPFSYFGTKSLTPVVGELPSTPVLSRKVSQSSFSELAMQSSYIPDYTIRAITDVTYFQISRSMYIAAKQATLLEKSYTTDATANTDAKADEQLHANLDEVVCDGKPKEKAMALGKNTSRGSISEKRSKSLQHGIKEENNKLILESPKNKHDTVLVVDNNNISVIKNNPKKEEKLEELNRNNMSRVILIPKDEKVADLQNNQEANIIVKREGDELEKFTHF